MMTYYKPGAKGWVVELRSEVTEDYEHVSYWAGHERGYPNSWGPLSISTAVFDKRSAAETAIRVNLGRRSNVQPVRVADAETVERDRIIKYAAKSLGQIGMNLEDVVSGAAR